jgi:hypothetical protein
MLSSKIMKTIYNAVVCLAGLGVVVLLLGGCAGPALRTSFNDYAGVYAEVSNRQMLLNLARLSNSHPAYFLQMGGINTTYQFVASAGTNTVKARNESFVGAPIIPILDAISFGANIGGSRNEQPSFNFTPLAGGIFAQAVLVPISPNVLFALYEQGYRVDHLLRTLVQSIELIDSEAGTSQIFINTPDEETPKNFSDFLTLCGVARELQKRNLLIISTQTSLSPVPSPLFENLKLEDILKAGAQGMVLKEVAPSKYGLSQTASSTAFKLDPMAQVVMHKLGDADVTFRLEGHGVVSSAEGKQSGMVIRLRPFISILQAVATEAAIFDAIVAADPGFLSNLPSTQRQPILRLKWDNIASTERLPPLTELDYAGSRYMISDFVPTHPQKSYNRNIFMLLNFLFSQVAMDSSKLSTPQLIQLK